MKKRKVKKKHYWVRKLICIIFILGLWRISYSIYLRYSRSSIEVIAEERNMQAKISQLKEKYKNNSNIDKKKIDELSELVNKNEDALPILENYEKYPDELINLVLENEETVIYVADYLEQKEVKKNQQVDISKDMVKKEVPLFLQWDERWGYEEYAGGLLGYKGSGPTCLSMVYVYLTENLIKNPKEMLKLSEDLECTEEKTGTKPEFVTKGANELGLETDEIEKSENSIKKKLKDDNVIVCVVEEGDIFGKEEFLLITNYNDGEISIKDPNSKKNSSKKWKYGQIEGQIKKMWAVSKKK